ncbi:hypothetical protein MCOR19_000603 [Pyricularia oryzae]|nr:hypothetical protein MCOR19_000603 [Pyricularia oryzae]KAI6457926.1 hypothetical protein MCOR15_006604 [Pyricularia oryzae]KAI6484278.1 hypothetical protein MCOR18_004041 [Pyricularia oryzae]KAI6520184.1 hypothetical protein MCOR16_008346 [Pyricularia oryzae]
MPVPSRENRGERPPSPLNDPAPSTDSQNLPSSREGHHSEHRAVPSPPIASPPDYKTPQGSVPQKESETMSSAPTISEPEGNRTAFYFEQLEAVLRKLQTESARVTYEAKSKDRQIEQKLQDRIDGIESKATNISDEIKQLRNTVAEENATRAEIKELQKRKESRILFNKNLKFETSVLEKELKHLREQYWKTKEDTTSAYLAKEEIQKELKRLQDEKQQLDRQIAEARLDEDGWETDDSSQDSVAFSNDRRVNPSSLVDEPVSDNTGRTKTIRITVPAVDDLRDSLAEFSRLRRLGKFRLAFELFEQQLAHHLDNRYIQDQYGWYLLETGQLEKLVRLVEVRPAYRIFDALETSWKFLREEADLVRWSASDKEEIMTDAMELLMEPWPVLDSAEMTLLSKIVTCTRLAKHTFPPSAWASLVESLVDAGMIWEFRDLVEAVVSSTQHSTEAFLWRVFRSEQDPLKDPVERLCAAWVRNVKVLEQVDESTLSAMLEILSILSMGDMSRGYRFGKRQRCLQYAQLFASELVGRDAENMKTRPYAVWLVAKAFDGRAETWLRSHDLVNFPDAPLGSMICHYAVFPKRNGSIYIPADDETPTWKPGCLSVDDVRVQDTYRLVLRVAEENGDALMQDACLQGLAYLTPGGYEARFQQLSEFYSSTNSIFKRQLVNLSRYMEAHTPSARHSLRQDMLRHGPPLHAPYEEAHWMILRALSSSEPERRCYLDLAESARAYAEQSGSLALETQDVFRNQLQDKTNQSRYSTAGADSSSCKKAKTSKNASSDKSAKHSRLGRLRLAQLPRRPRNKYGGVRARSGRRRTGGSTNERTKKKEVLQDSIFVETAHQIYRASRDASTVLLVGESDGSLDSSFVSGGGESFRFIRGVFKLSLHSNRHAWEYQDSSGSDSESWSV